MFPSPYYGFINGCHNCWDTGCSFSSSDCLIDLVTWSF